MFKWGHIEIFVHKDQAGEFGKRMWTIGDILRKYNLNEVYKEEIEK